MIGMYFLCYHFFLLFLTWTHPLLFHILSFFPPLFVTRLLLFPQLLLPSPLMLLCSLLFFLHVSALARYSSLGFNGAFWVLSPSYLCPPSVIYTYVLILHPFFHFLLTSAFHFSTTSISTHFSPLFLFSLLSTFCSLV